jgi:ribonuclease Z
LRELVVLGTASQAPTRYRNHNGYLLRWDEEGILFDPGEGTQRQFLFAGVSSSAVTRICVTHFHGDHCLGLPGVLQRLSLDQVAHPVDVYYPAGGQAFYERLRHCALYNDTVEIRPHPVPGDGVVAEGAFTLSARRLDHRTETLGWRLVEPDGRRMLPDRLEAAGIGGPDVGRLQREGSLRTPDGGVVTLGEMSEPRPGQKFALVMDTRLCDAAFELAAGVDLLVCESTFLDRDRHLAEAYAHLTAAQAARIAAEAGAGHLVLTHFSQRYGDPEEFRREAEAVFPAVTVAADLDRIQVPGRIRKHPGNIPPNGVVPASSSPQDRLGR